MSVSIVLCDVQMDDARPNRQNCITRYMKKKETPKSCLDVSREFVSTIANTEVTDAELSEPVSSMVDIVSRMTDAEIFLQLKVSSFDLILSLDFIMQLVKFLYVPDEKAAVDAASPDTVNAAPVTTASVSQPGKGKFSASI